MNKSPCSRCDKRKPHQHCNHLNLQIFLYAAGNASIKFDANNVLSGKERTTISPQRPCRKTPSPAELSAEPSADPLCAHVAAIIPVNTSPIPPDAIAGFPVVFS